MESYVWPEWVSVTRACGLTRSFTVILNGFWTSSVSRGVRCIAVYCACCCCDFYFIGDEQQRQQRQHNGRITIRLDLSSSPYLPPNRHLTAMKLFTLCRITNYYCLVPIIIDDDIAVFILNNPLTPPNVHRMLFCVKQ